MKTAVKDICQLVGQVVDVPVFDHTLPDGYASVCVVVRETDFDEEQEEGTYHVDVYAPNTTRTHGEPTDGSYPNMDVLTQTADPILSALRDVCTDEFNGWITKRNLLKEGITMHYITICLTIQFN